MRFCLPLFFIWTTILIGVGTFAITDARDQIYAITESAKVWMCFCFWIAAVVYLPICYYFVKGMKADTEPLLGESREPAESESIKKWTEHWSKVCVLGFAFVCFGFAVSGTVYLYMSQLCSVGFVNNMRYNLSAYTAWYSLADTEYYDATYHGNVTVTPWTYNYREYIADGAVSWNNGEPPFQKLDNMWPLGGVVFLKNKPVGSAQFSAVFQLPEPRTCRIVALVHGKVATVNLNKQCRTYINVFASDSTLVEISRSETNTVFTLDLTLDNCADCALTFRSVFLDCE